MGAPSDHETKYDPQQGQSMSKHCIMKNVIVISFGFFFLFCAFQSLASLQTTIDKHGSTAQSAIYGAYIISSLLFPKLMISKLGCKYTLVISAAAYIPFMVSNYFRELRSQLLTSILLGLGGGTLWSSGCTYINEISVMYSPFSSESVDVTTTWFFGIFFMIFQNSQIWGNLASFYVLRPTYDVGSLAEESETTVTDSTTMLNNDNVTCGFDFCGQIDQNVTRLSGDKRFVLITVYLAFSVVAVLVMLFFLDSLPRTVSNDEQSSLLLSKLAATMKHLRKLDQVLLIPITIFVGLEQAFILSDYSQGYIACALGLSEVSQVFICFGVVSAISAFLTGRLSKYVHRTVILLTAVSGNVAAFVIMFLWNPDGGGGRGNALIFFATISFWGMSDAVWQTEVAAIYGILFRKDEEAAYGNLRFWEGIGFFIPYFCNQRLCMYSKLYLMIGALSAGLLGYLTVEIRVFSKKSQCVISENVIQTKK